MAQVTVTINGYAYTVGCDDGQEEHLQAMAQEVENHIEQIRKLGGQSGEGRLLALASLLMADKLYDLQNHINEINNQNTIKKLEEENKRLKEQLMQFTIRVEGIANKLKIS
ncbi:MAG: cell division protein ZapA [Commensalibacter sp.]|nr:cell division protein ZapA [Commensalibacter sp.]